MTHGIQVTTTAGLAIGVGFIIIFSVAVPALSANLGANSKSSYESGPYMPAPYLLYGCELPSSGLAALEYSQGKNDNSTSSLSTNAPSTIGDIKERTWISVSRIDRSHGLWIGEKASCTIVTSELAVRIPTLTRAIQGAEGCMEGTEVCQVSYGLSIAGDGSDYELTITKQEAAEILKGVPLGEYNAAMLASGDSFYTMRFHTSDEYGPAQAEIGFLGPAPSYEPVALKPGESINYTLIVKTWATYGGPAKVSLIAASSAKDSGLVLDFEPITLYMEERSEAEAVLRITASQVIRHGTYEIALAGKINDLGYIPIESCDHSCIAISVGGSDWRIQTFGNDIMMWQGGPGETPDWLRLQVQTDKDSYSIGEPIEIEAYLVNEGLQRLVVGGTESSPRLMGTIGGPVGVSHISVYGIDAYDDAAPPIIVEPMSKTLLARTFIWDQTTFRYDLDPEQVAAGKYNIAFSFAGYDNAVLVGNHEIRISPSVGD